MKKKHESKGGYAGGSTVLTSRDKEWFAKKSTKVPKNPAGKRPNRSAKAQKEFEAFAAAQARPPQLLGPDLEAPDMTPRQKAKARQHRKKISAPKAL